MTTPVPRPTDEYFAKLKRQCDEAERLRKCAFEDAIERMRPWEETKRATELASYGIWAKYENAVDDPENQPIGIEDRHVIVISNALWARRICDAALKWAKCPGIACLTEKPIPDIGPGFDAGQRIFFAAAGGATRKQVADMLAKARTALGPWKGLGSGQPHRECELGIWGFFKQIYRYLEGGGWNPPASERTAKVIRAREKSQAPTPTRSPSELPSAVDEKPVVHDVRGSQGEASTTELAAKRNDRTMKPDVAKPGSRHPLIEALGDRLSLTTGATAARNCLNELLRRFDGSPETFLTSEELRNKGFSSAGTEVADCPDRVKRMYGRIIQPRAFPEAKMYLSTRTKKGMPMALILHLQPKSRPARRRSP